LQEEKRIEKMRRDMVDVEADFAQVKVKGE